MKTVIMAGGKGTRISSLRADIPKPMIPICGKPILEHQIIWLKEQGYTDIILIIGHLGDCIRTYFGDGTQFGVRITYIVEDMPLGTAGALYYLKSEINEDFLLINGDIICDVALDKFYRAHKQSNCMATILVHPNDHPYDSGIIVRDQTGIVTKWYHKEDEKGWYKNCVNAGLHFLSASILDLFQEVKKVDLDRDVLKKLIVSRELFAYQSPEYVKDMGTPERYKEVENDITSGRVHSKNLKNKQKAVFFDRDGTINEYVGFLRNISDFKLKSDAVNLIKKANSNGYLVIVVTNQPVIARGEVTWEELDEIHNKMETLLGEQGAYVDDIFICPHHPDKGFPGERIEYKIRCTCRKPEPGMIIEASNRYNIDLKNSIMVGDTENDYLAAKAAGIGRYIDINNCKAVEL